MAVAEAAGFSAAERAWGSPSSSQSSASRSSLVGALVRRLEASTMKRLIAFAAIHSRSFRVRLLMGRSSRPRASSQHPIASAASVVA